MKKWTTITAIAVLGAGATTFALQAPSAVLAKSRPGASTIKSVSSTTSVPKTVTIGDKVAPLQLRDTAGKPVTIGQWNKSKATVLMFVSTNCPVSNAYNARMASLQSAYGSRGVRLVGINANAGENGAQVAAHAKQNGFGFAVYKDPQNKIADRFDAKVTPEVFVVGPKGDLLYKGRIDNSMNEGEVKDLSLQTALKAILAGNPVVEKETRAFGCSIKREY